MYTLLVHGFKIRPKPSQELWCEVVGSVCACSVRLGSWHAGWFPSYMMNASVRVHAAVALWCLALRIRVVIWLDREVCEAVGRGCAVYIVQGKAHAYHGPELCLLQGQQLSCTLPLVWFED